RSERSWPRVFDEIVEQAEAKRLLEAALAERPAHAYLFHGPAGVGKSKAAFAFAAALLGDRGRVERRAHPDLYVLEPLGDQIRIDEIRTLRRDLHMRPFEAAWRVYVIVSAHLLNAEAADARREERLSIARSVYADPGFSSGAAASRLLELVDEGAKEARELVDKQLEWLDLPAREAELRRRRAELGAQREGVLEALEELA